MESLRREYVGPPVFVPCRVILEARDEAQQGVAPQAVRPPQESGPVLKVDLGVLDRRGTAHPRLLAAVEVPETPRHAAGL